MSDSFPYRLYLVVSEDSCPNADYLTVAEQAIRGGVDLVQLREKHCDDETFLSRARRLREVLDNYNVPLIINDNLPVAMQVEAYGIHVGQHDVTPCEIRKRWPKCRSLGYSIENLHQLEMPQAEASDCFGVSPVFQTATKTDTVTEWGLEGIRTIRQKTTKPLIAIGSMNKHNAYEVIRAGADCIAVVSAICGAKDPERAAAEIREQIEKAV